MKKLYSIFIMLAMFLGLIVLPVFAEDPPKSMYDSANDGDLLYTANFNGDGIWVNPSHNTAVNNSVVNTECFASGHPSDKPELDTIAKTYTTDNLTVAADGSNSNKATLNNSVKDDSLWGANLQGMPLDASHSYTLKWKLKRTADNAGFGISIDGYYGCYSTPKKANVFQFWNNGMSEQVFDNLSNVSEIPGTSASAGTPSEQEYALEVNGLDGSLNVYIKTAEGKWQYIVSKSGLTFGSQLGIFIYGYYVATAEISDLCVYKGISVVENENKAVQPLESEPVKEETSKADTTNQVTETQVVSGNVKEETSKTDTSKTTNPPPVLIEDTDNTTSNKTSVEKEKGCSSSIGFGGVLLLIVSAAGITGISFKRKKYE